MILNERKFLKKLFESNENPVVANGEQDKDRFHLEDYIQYYNKPGIIVATIRGNSDTSLQQLPVGAVDNFRFMKVTDENAIANQDKNNGKTYDMILKEYEGTKNGIIDSWKKGNMSKLQGVMNKYGDKFLGLDIVQNEKQIQHKLSDEEKAKQKEEQGDDKGRDAEELKEIDRDTPNNGEETNEGFSFLKNLFNSEKMKSLEEFYKKYPNTVNDIIKQIRSIRKNGGMDFYDKTKLVWELPDSDKFLREETSSKEVESHNGIDLENSTTMNYHGNKYIILGSSVNDDTTMKDFAIWLQKQKISKISQDVKGFIVVNSSNKSDINEINSNGFPIISFEIKDGKGIFKCHMETINHQKDGNNYDEIFS